jgi:hypothetical protein
MIVLQHMSCYLARLLYYCLLLLVLLPGPSCRPWPAA